MIVINTQTSEQTKKNAQNDQKVAVAVVHGRPRRTRASIASRWVRRRRVSRKRRPFPARNFMNSTRRCFQVERVLQTPLTNKKKKEKKKPKTYPFLFLFLLLLLPRGTDERISKNLKH